MLSDAWQPTRRLLKMSTCLNACFTDGTVPSGCRRSGYLSVLCEPVQLEAIGHHINNSASHRDKLERRTSFNKHNDDRQFSMYALVCIQSLQARCVQAAALIMIQGPGEQPYLHGASSGSLHCCCSRPAGS
jgi:hypothetical protein